MRFRFEVTIRIAKLRRRQFQHLHYTDFSLRISFVEVARILKQRGDVEGIAHRGNIYQTRQQRGMERERPGSKLGQDLPARLAIYLSICKKFSHNPIKTPF